MDTPQHTPEAIDPDWTPEPFAEPASDSTALEEASRPEVVKYAFLVSVLEDDTVMVRMQYTMEEAFPSYVRVATQEDIMNTSQRIAQDLRDDVNLQRIAETLHNMLQGPQQPQQADTLRQALADRGIELSINPPQQ
jgi:hypothetical protein